MEGNDSCTLCDTLCVLGAPFVSKIIWLLKTSSEINKLILI